MWQQIRNNPRAAVLAVLAHVIFIVILLVSFNFSNDEPGAKGTLKPKAIPEAIKAEAIDEKQINAEIQRRRDLEKRQQQKIREQARRKKEAQLREKKRRAEKKKQQAAEKKRLAAEKKRKLAEKKRKQKEAAEKKRKLALKKKQEREKRLAEEKKRKEIERKRIEEEERKQQEELARQEAEMKQKLEADRQRRDAARQQAQHQANQREIGKYLGLIKNAVSRHWTLPSADVSGLSCEVKVRIIPSGEVIDVQIIKSSGNLAFDRSVETAVYRAAPLPVPSIESGLFDEFREVIFSFEPRDI